jgi:hypothetical protein
MRLTRIAHYRLRVRCHVFAPENTNLSSASRPSTDWRSVALKGSRNRSVPTGYKVVRVPFNDGRPEGYYENFATGFWASGEQRAEVWGRPAALAVAKEGRRWSPTTPAARSGAFPTRAHPPSTPVRRRKTRDRARNLGQWGAERRPGARWLEVEHRRQIAGLVR